MKSFCTLLLLVLALTKIHGQQEKFQALLDSGKLEFSKTPDQQDYQKALYFLEKAIEIQPDNSEALYHLGYAYSRLNSQYGSDIIDMNLKLLIRSSKQFEKVIQLTPNYTGDLVVLDPYSKISAEWGSMALKHLYNDKKDSAIWAFKEGKRRGGFGEFWLKRQEKMLGSCSPNAILFSPGDNITFPIMYLQTVNQYRQDVKVVDMGLLSSQWYPKHLTDKNIVAFDLSETELDTLQYLAWSDSTITIQDFSWLVKPTYYDQYLLRGDLLLLSLIRENLFNSDIYFSQGTSDESLISLAGLLSEGLFIQKLEPSAATSLSLDEFKKAATNALMLFEHLNMNSDDQVLIFDSLRILIFLKAYLYAETDEISNAREVMKLLEEKAYLDELPFLDTGLNSYFQTLKLKVR
ncbi:MAG: tetratricopeptide repeat protein [Roseivirga sp.]|nr:tetratricopeptide repeat protein [Roseivirga sp.]